MIFLTSIVVKKNLKQEKKTNQSNKRIDKNSKKIIRNHNTRNQS